MPPSGTRSLSLSPLKKELARKAWHLFLLGYLAVYFALGPELFLKAIAAWVAAVFLLETLRLRVSAVNQALLVPFSIIIREREHTTYSGVSYGALGIGLAALAFGKDPRVMTAAIASLALADSSAALVGMAFGRHAFVIRGQRRSLEGSAAGFAAALACGWAAGLGPRAAWAAAGGFLAADCLP